MIQIIKKLVIQLIKALMIQEHDVIDVVDKLKCFHASDSKAWYVGIQVH